MTSTNPEQQKKQGSNKTGLIDKIVEYFLDSQDKTSFSGKDKILFYKELV